MTELFDKLISYFQHLFVQYTMITELLDKLILYFQYPFVQYAMIVGVLIALCSSLLGVTLVLKRFSFIGDGLSHVAFGVMAIAAALNLSNNTILVLPVTVACAILLLRTGQNTKIKGDAAIAMISVGTLAIGYLIMNVFSKSSNLSGDVCATLFGSTSILTLTMTEVWICTILSVWVITVFCLFYHKIFAVTFDQDFAEATGNNAELYNLILSVVIAVVIVLAMNLVGALLISALVIFPALSAMRVFKTFKSVTICAVIVSVACAALGILASIVAGTPVGSTIVAVDILGFMIFSIVGALRGKIRVMKTIMPIVLLSCILVSACSDNKSADSESILDLTILSSTMMYAEVSNITESPVNYLGKTIKIEGPYYPYYSAETEMRYHFVLIEDAASCCQQGLEFRWTGEHVFPDEYPPEGAKIQVTGVFKSYEEAGQYNCYLAVDDIIVVK